ncbi:MAG TPA: tetratricopeptide repeat protein, partial [Hyphomicrobiaceae bacterium]|nr:tetratricopeptide repeat protein [Hyphomicrobiaceae bacterium]
MAKEKVTRRLAAIFAADMVGYSRLMEADEEGTIARQKTHRKELIDPKISEHSGRIVKTTGDGMLVEFASVVDAVRCAVEVQQAMAEREADVPVEHRIQYRVGINLGDIVIEGEDVMGDGVNVAARLEALAKPGEVLISGTAFDQLKKKLEYGYQFRGERKVKNIAEPVRVYRVLPDSDAGSVSGQRFSQKSWRWIAAAAVLLLVVTGVAWWQPWVARVEAARPAKMAFPLPMEPSIAVLPFDNLSGDKAQNYLADGLTENIISALSKAPGMFVIARNSSFTYKGKAVKVRKVAEELGVRYVMEGGVQRSSNRIRVTAKLIDAVKGRQLWSERYDRKLTDLFAVQDDITLRIVAALEVRLTEGEQSRLRFGRGTRSIEAWASATQGWALYRTLSRENNARARQLLQKATKLDPSFAWAWTVLANTHWGDARNGWSASRAESMRKAIELANKSKALDDSVPFTYSLLGLIHLLKRDYAQAIADCEKAVALDPSGADSKAVLAVVLTYAGRPREAATLLERAMRLNPRYPGWYLVTLGRAYRMSGRLDDAIEALQRAKQRI